MKKTEDKDCDVNNICNIHDNYNVVDRILPLADTLSSDIVNNIDQCLEQWVTLVISYPR